MTFFRLDASLRTDGSVSRALADTVEREWVRAHPHAAVVRRDVGQTPVPPMWPAAVSAATSPADHVRTPEELSASALASTLVDELAAADALLLAVPIYNFGVPQQVKHWIDMIMTDPRAGRAETPFLAGRPAVLVEARGGGYGPGTPREGWDHATPYLQRMLGDVWGLEILTVRAELTLADVTPAMAHLVGLAEQQLTQAQVTASEHGRLVARRLRPAA